MMSSQYLQVYDLLRQYPLELSIDEEIIFLQNDDEVVSVRGSDEVGKLRIGYMTLEKRIALRTLRDCPEIVKKWYAGLLDSKGIGSYEFLPHFESTLDFEDVLGVCLYLASKMVDNERRLQGKPTNSQMADTDHSFSN